MPACEICSRKFRRSRDCCSKMCCVTLADARSMASCRCRAFSTSLGQTKGQASKRELDKLMTVTVPTSVPSIEVSLPLCKPLQVKLVPLHPPLVDLDKPTINHMLITIQATSTERMGGGSLTLLISSRMPSYLCFFLLSTSSSHASNEESFVEVFSRVTPDLQGCSILQHMNTAL